MLPWSSGSFTAEPMRTDIFIFRLCAAAILAALLSACAGSPLSPAEMAARRVSKTSAEWNDGVEGVIRYNPARCDCPQFELLAGGAWHRVEITNDIREDTTVAGMFDEAIAAGPGWSCRIAGGARGVEKQRYRFRVVRLEITALCRDGTCPVSDDDSGRAGGPESTDDNIHEGENR